jgi:DNA-binding response OmpR family regulator
MHHSTYSGKTILLAEDDRAISSLYSHKLVLDGYKVLQAFDGVEMLGILKNNEIDLVLLDLRMPKMSGDEALERMRKIKKYSNTPVIVLTNIGREEAPKTLWHLGISEYIVKVNITPKEMADKIRLLL